MKGLKMYEITMVNKHILANSGYTIDPYYYSSFIVTDFIAEDFMDKFNEGKTVYTLDHNEGFDLIRYADYTDIAVRVYNE